MVAATRRSSTTTLRSILFWISVLAHAVSLSTAAVVASGTPTRSTLRGDRILNKANSDSDSFVAPNDAMILEARALLVSMGVPERNLCTGRDLENAKDNHDNEATDWILPPCSRTLDRGSNRDHPFREEDSDESSTSSRRLHGEGETIEEEDPWFVVVMALSALGCVLTAALAAGLTMGMLSLDPLMLLVKIRASRSPEERAQAESLLPIVKQHHRLLVTLLLLNSMANEALPLFLEVLVPPIVSVLLSVTFVLIFGEILPSAIFTGPKKLELASKMVPLVKTVMILAWPIAYPIAKVLDKFLHEDDDEEGAFGRGEISALVRIQYEERIANKRQRKLERMDVDAPLAKSNKNKSFRPREPNVEDAIRSIKAGSLRGMSIRRSSLEGQSVRSDIDAIHVDEVMMVEGALQMKTKAALDAFTPIHRLFAVPENLVLNEDSIVDIYSSGYSRVPVYEPDPSKPKSQAAIKGILMTKQLIVVNLNEERPLITMPLMVPTCVSPTMNLVQLVNLFQTGRSGHFALVCARPQMATDALNQGNAVPAKAGLMGIITLEDVLEELLQEEIYDENDQMEKEAERIALWVGRKWRCLKRKRELAALGKPTSLGSVVDAVMANESTSLIERDEDTGEQSSGLLGYIFGK